MLEALKKFNTEIKKNLDMNIVFTGERGSDSGGLTREFYELIGKTMKNS